jgi:hypothetical protein
MPKAWPAKDPDEILRYTYDATPDLADAEIITSAAASLPVPAGAAIQGAASHDDKNVSVVIGGGTDGLEASIQIDFATSAGETFQTVIALPIASRIGPVAHPGDYTLPTAANLIAAFPEFSNVSGSVIKSYLARAATAVDNSWNEPDFAYAQMLYAAHLMTLFGIGSSPEAASASSGMGDYRVLSSGSLRMERFDKASTGYEATRYGREFRRLLRMNRGGPRTTGAAGGGWGAGDNFGPWTAP